MSGRAAAVVGLVSTPGMTPARLADLLGRCPDPEVALAALGADGAGALAGAEAVVARRRTRVFLAGDPGYPITDELPGRPAVLLAEGERPEALDAPRVAIVGTRAATPHGLADARDLGAFLAGHGVSVVSGLAIGIDGAAHTGALDGRWQGGADRRGGHRPRRGLSPPAPCPLRAGPTARRAGR